MFRSAFSCSKYACRNADKKTANARLSSMVQGVDWTIYDTYAAQSMCPYETVSEAMSQLSKHSVDAVSLLSSRLLILTWGL